MIEDLKWFVYYNTIHIMLALQCIIYKCTYVITCGEPYMLTVVLCNVH